MISDFCADFGREIWIASHDARDQLEPRSGYTSRLDDVMFEGVFEDNSAAKIDDFNNTELIDTTIIQFQITMRKAHFMQISRSRDNLFKTASNFLFALFSGHHNTKL
jgi:hypothetical protein